jgi:hypothetical protein
MVVYGIGEGRVLSFAAVHLLLLAISQSRRLREQAGLSMQQIEQDASDPQAGLSGRRGDFVG